MLTAQSIRVDELSQTVTIIEIEEGELGFELPDNIIVELGLKIGDTVIWEQTDGGWILKKEKDND